jgi:hypothetical protein
MVRGPEKDGIRVLTLFGETWQGVTGLKLSSDFDESTAIVAPYCDVQVMPVKFAGKFALLYALLADVLCARCAASVVVRVNGMWG